MHVLHAAVTRNEIIKVNNYVIFFLQIALNSLKVDSLDVYVTGHVITVKSSEGVAEKHELAVSDDVNMCDIRGYADDQGILHFVASEIAKP